MRDLIREPKMSGTIHFLVYVLSNALVNLIYFALSLRFWSLYFEIKSNRLYSNIINIILIRGTEMRQQFKPWHRVS